MNRILYRCCILSIRPGVIGRVIGGPAGRDGDGRSIIWRAGPGAGTTVGLGAGVIDGLGVIAGLGAGVGITTVGL